MRMTILSLAASTGLLLGSAAMGYTQAPGGAGMKGGSPGASGASPGHQMQEHGSRPGEPGASGYAPGHERMGDRDDRTTGRGGDRDDRTTGRGDRDRDDRLRGD